MMLKDRAGSGRPRNWGSQEGKMCALYSSFMPQEWMGRERVCKKNVKLERSYHQYQNSACTPVYMFNSIVN